MSTRETKSRSWVAALAALALVAGTGMTCANGGDEAASGQAPPPAPLADVERSLGDLAPGESTTVVFEVAINQPLPAVPSSISEVSNQGTISGDNFADVLTDDPDTAAPADPTVTPISYEDGDLNMDGVVDFETDSPLFFAQFGQPLAPAGTPPDYDGDGFVGHGDYGMFLSFF